MSPGVLPEWKMIARGRGVSEQIVVIPTKSGNFDPYWREGHAQGARHPNPVNSEWRRYHDGARPGYEELPFAYPTLACWREKRRKDGRRKDAKISLSNGVGIGHAKGWRLAAEAMGIDWMKREELTQAIPPAYTEHIGHQLLHVLERSTKEALS